MLENVQNVIIFELLQWLMLQLTCENILFCSIQFEQFN